MSRINYLLLQSRWDLYFLDKAEEFLRKHHQRHYKGLNSVMNIADIFELPCKVLDEEGRQRGIGNLFGN